MKKLDIYISFKETPIGLIPYNWDLGKLGELTERIFTGTTPPVNIREYHKYGVNFIRSQNIFDHYIDSENIVKLNEKSIKAMRSYEIRSGDVLLNITGDGITFLRCCKIPDTLLPAYANQSIAIIRTNRNLDSDFLALFLSLTKIKEYMEGFNSGSARRTLAAKHVQEYLIPIPPENEQKAISLIFKEIQNRINFNNSMNSTLESLAQSLFYSWFVRFDPFKDGEFEESELGKIPNGWKVIELKNIVSKISNQIDPKEISSDTAYLSLGHMPRGSIAIDKYGTAAEVVSNQLLFKKGDILFGKLRPYFKKVGIPFQDGICSTDIIVFRAKENFFGLALMYISSEKFIEYAVKISTGTRMPRADPSSLLKFKVVVPDEKNYIFNFNKTIQKIVDKLYFNIQENLLLSSLRNLLLPQLLSGKLRIPNPVKFLEEINGENN
ncbi:hypothetical protein ES705_06230 [subsurface metagenome]